MNILYLASQSQTRKKLLTLADIPFCTIAHKSSECGIDLTHSFEEYVLAIAKHKMEEVNLQDPTIDPQKTPTIFVLTADTLIRTCASKQILGKPTDLEDAKRMLRIIQEESVDVATGCCLEKKSFVASAWKTIAHKYWVTAATCDFYVDEESLDLYFKKMPQALYGCGAGIVEDFGYNFLKSVNGSFTTILGLPLFELRMALKELGFWG